MKQKLTIEDIARIAGVSTATVSRVLSGSPRVRETTRERVLSVVTQEGYEPNHVARSLAKQKSDTVGLVVEDIGNPFFTEAAKQIESALHKAGYSMLLTTSGWSDEREVELVRTLVRNRVDGVILSPVSAESTSTYLLQRYGVPFVLLNVHSTNPRICSVCTDDEHGGRLAARALLNARPELLVCLQGFPHETTFSRVRGFIQEVDRTPSGAERKRVVIDNVRTYDEGYDVVGRLIQYERIQAHRTGLFATNDDVAMGVIAALRDRGVPIPSQVAVVGYDDIPQASRFQIPLTTIGQDIQQLATCAARELIELMKNPSEPSHQHELLPRLVQRASTVYAELHDWPEDIVAASTLVPGGRD